MATLTKIKIDDMVLALLYLTTFERTDWVEGLEGPQLGTHDCLHRKRIHLRSSEIV